MDTVTEGPLPDEKTTLAVRPTNLFRTEHVLREEFPNHRRENVIDEKGNVCEVWEFDTTREVYDLKQRGLEFDLFSMWDGRLQVRMLI